MFYIVPNVLYPKATQINVPLRFIDSIEYISKFFMVYISITPEWVYFVDCHVCHCEEKSDLPRNTFYMTVFPHLILTM